MGALKIAIVGSRDYPDLEAVAHYVGLLPKDFTVISGGADGVDKKAVNIAKKLGLQTKEHPPKYESYGDKVAPLMRNEEIVKTCDKLVAFWDVASNGTKHAIRCAMMEGKLLKVFTPFGVLKPKE